MEEQGGGVETNKGRVTRQSATVGKYCKISVGTSGHQWNTYLKAEQDLGYFYTNHHLRATPKGVFSLTFSVSHTTDKVDSEKASDKEIQGLAVGIWASVP